MGTSTPSSQCSIPTSCAAPTQGTGSSSSFAGPRTSPAERWAPRGSAVGEIDNLEAWLITVVGRVALNMLRSRKTRREEPLGAHLPDPIVDRADGVDPEHEALLADSVGLALFVGSRR